MNKCFLSVLSPGNGILNLPANLYTPITRKH